MHSLQTITHFISKYLMVLIIGFSCIAYIVPEYFTWAIAYTPFLLGIAMFGMGLTIKFVLVFLHNIQSCLYRHGPFAMYSPYQQILQSESY